MKKKTKIFITIVIVLILSIVIMPSWLRKALYHNFADIDDYKLFDNRVVKAGKPQKWKISKTTKQLKDSSIKHLEELKTIAFVLIKDTQIIYEQYWDGYSENSLSGSFSVAKSFVALMVGCAIDDGKIKSIEQSVGDFIPEFKKEELENIKIKHLLNMSSGLDWNESYANPFSVTTQAYYDNDLYSLVSQQHMIETPGIKFKYLSGNTQLLGIVVNKATGKNLAEYFSEKIWQPMGCEKDALWSTDTKDGIEKAYCCFNSNARDFAKLGQLILQNGKWDSTQLIAKQYVEKAITPDSTILDENNQTVDFYGFQFWIMHHKGLTIPYCRGIKGQYIFIIPQKNAVLVRLGEKRIKNHIRHTPEDAYLWIDMALELL